MDACVLQSRCKLLVVVQDQQIFHKQVDFLVHIHENWHESLLYLILKEMYFNQSSVNFNLALIYFAERALRLKMMPLRKHGQAIGTELRCSSFSFQFI